MNLLKLSPNSTSMSYLSLLGTSSSSSSTVVNNKFSGLYTISSSSSSYPLNTYSSHLYTNFKFTTTAFATRKSVNNNNKKKKKNKKKLPTDISFINNSHVNVIDDDHAPLNNNDDVITTSSSTSSRGMVLQACTLTSALIAAFALIIRQGSHIASSQGLPISDCSTQVSFAFETWHLGLITGLVILISSSRYLLLKTWPEFAESSEAANHQVLTSLQPLDYAVVAFLPGISEEFLFRGALLPFFGMNWVSVLLVAGIFGVLHLGSGRKVSFAIWATFVGLVYGYATIASSSMIVPMASHSLNNLVGGILWRYTSLDDNSPPT
ncbi:hypothetical protein ACFE04_022113 [Oxalis oulophora]